MIHATASALFLAATLLARTFACDASTSAAVARPDLPRATRSIPTIKPATPSSGTQAARPAAPRTEKRTLPAHLFM
jgi:hypothetical protein